ncbi:hypothetical protein CMT41_03810 [Colwellia sp. MT41]|uniref:hypothetical protein n=1 Tax=Colwellia sp. MT41 TaxID=58049 RepID=UPI0007177727|nr:hypothetical protein [Colwellia sp. MT41]ALO33950.1 hypothetical protein CMT41_03810 [Colwellia sp. MT41]
MCAMLSPSLDLTFDFNLGNEVAVAAPRLIAGSQSLTKVSRQDKMSCQQDHQRQFDESALTTLAEYQMHGKGKHKCCHCAYNSGFKQGSLLQNFISLDIDSLGDAQVSADGGYKSVHQAFALGYSDGVNSFIRS